MIWQDEFVELDKSVHDRSSFDCDEEELNTFLLTHAAKHRQAGLSKTFLLPASSTLDNGKHPICAFFTNTMATISRSNMPEKLAKKLPHYPIPVFLLAQMAVAKNFKGQGLGKITLVRALEHFHEVSKHIPAWAVIVDCLNGDAESFYLQYDFKKLCKHNGRTRMYLPIKTVNSLFS